MPGRLYQVYRCFECRAHGSVDQSSAVVLERVAHGGGGVWKKSVHKSLYLLLYMSILYIVQLEKVYVPQARGPGQADSFVFMYWNSLTMLSLSYIYTGTAYFRRLSASLFIIGTVINSYSIE